MLNLDKFPAKPNFLKTKIRLILCTSMFLLYWILQNGPYGVNVWKIKKRYQYDPVWNATLWNAKEFKKLKRHRR